MEQEIDLRQYIAVLLKYKYWIVGLTIIAALAALIVSLLSPVVYQATALVGVVEPRYTLQFDARMATVNTRSSAKAYLDVATNDDLVTQLIAELSSDIHFKNRSVRAVRQLLSAQSGSDPSVIRLQARNRDAQRSAQIANYWADLFVRMINDLYGQREQNMAFFQAQLAVAQASLSQAEQDLIDFQARNKTHILSQQLQSKQDALKRYLDLTHSLRLTIQDAQLLRERLGNQNAQQPLSLGDEWSAILLQIGAQTGYSNIQFQLTDTSVASGKTVGEQIAWLDALIVALQTKLSDVEQRTETLQPEILSLQTALEQANAEQSRLSLAKSVAQETMLVLSRKVAEAEIVAQDTDRDARLISYAAVPDKPVLPRKMVNTAVGGALGLCVSVLGAFAVEYWRSGKKAA